MRDTQPLSPHSQIELQTIKETQESNLNQLIYQKRRKELFPPQRPSTTHENTLSTPEKTVNDLPGVNLYS